MLTFVTVFISLLSLASPVYQELLGSDRESVPYWMGLVIYNLVVFTGFQV